MPERRPPAAPTAQRLRELLLTPEEASAMDAPGGNDAAVLVPLFERDGELATVFTERRADLAKHAGEISFPGGRPEPVDHGDLEATATRECFEEIGLPPGEVEIAGALAPTGTFVTNYRIVPYVGLVAPDHTWIPQESEVARTIELTLPELIEGHEMQRLLRKGVPLKMPTYTVRGDLIWGATARIVQQLLKRLAPLLPAQ